MSEHDGLTVDQALELLRQHHADGDDFGTDAAITIKRAQNLIENLRRRLDLIEDVCLDEVMHNYEKVKQVESICDGKLPKSGT